MGYLQKEFIRLAGRAVHRYAMIEHGDRVLVGLSGGKDSLALLDFLVQRRNRIPIDYEIVAVHLDMGYEDPQEQVGLERWAAAKGVPYYAEITDYAPRAHSEANRENPCFFCARLRRRRLFELARELDCTKVAFGHHRDDFNETLLMNILFSGEISTMQPVQEFFQGLLTVIRPLCMVPEDKIRRLIDQMEAPVLTNRCPSNGRSKRNVVKEIINSLAKGNDKIKGNIFSSLSNYRPDYLLNRGPGDRRTVKSVFINPHQGSPNRKESGTMQEDMRKRTRVRFKTTVNLSAAEKSMTDLTSRNLSLKGVYVETEEKLPIGTPVDLNIHLAGASSQVSLKMKGKVARVDSQGLGVDFVEIDLDSFVHLRNIVIYNADSPDEVDDELACIPAFQTENNYG